MSVHFFNLLSVPEGRDEEFLPLWREVNAHLAAQPGYLRHQLHRALGPTPFTYVNHGVWTTVADYRAAQDDRFRSLLAQPAWAAFPSTPSLYEVVHEGSRELSLVAPTGPVSRPS